MVGSGRLTSGSLRPISAGELDLPDRRDRRRPSRSRTGLAGKFLLKSIAAELRFFFEEELFFSRQKISGGESCDSPADDYDVGLVCGVRAFELMAVANLMAHFKMFAVNERAAGDFESGAGECFINRASCGDGNRRRQT